MATWYGRNVTNPTGVWGTNNQTIQGGLTATAAGSLILGGSSIGNVEQPTTRYYCGSIRLADGTAVPNNIICFMYDLLGNKEALYPNGVLTTNHPAGHPIYGVTETGWVCFTHVALAQNQHNYRIIVPPQNTIGIESGVSIEIIPALTSNGNG